MLFFLLDELDFANSIPCALLPFEDIAATGNLCKILQMRCCGSVGQFRALCEVAYTERM